MFITDVKQLTDAESVRRTIVIGAGAVGLHLANELVKRGRQVLVIEAGNMHLGNFSPETFRTDGRNHEGIRSGRSRSVGGTSNLWGGQLVEFQPVDFDGRDWLPESRWPVRYSEIQPYYPKTYDALGIPRDLQRDEAVWQAIRKESPVLSQGLEVFLTRWLKVPSLAVMLKDSITADPNLVVLGEHTATGFSYSGSRVISVTIRNKNGESFEIGGDNFVVAMGTIETSRLLLHCASDANCPWKQNRNLGCWFQDHLGGRIGKVHAASPKKFFDVFCTVAARMYKFAPKIRMKNEVLARERILNIQAMVDFESSISENLVYLKQFLKAAIFSRQFRGLGDFFKNMRACAKYLFPLMWRFIYDHRIFVPSDSKISLLIQAEQTPCRDSRLTLDGTVLEQDGLPKVVLNWKLGENELASIRAFAVKVERAMTEAGLAKLELNADLLASNPAFLSTLRDTTHQGGGAVMSDSPETGVVDRNLKIFGTDNIYVAGAATFRTVSNANTTFTAMTFATRLADHLALAGAEESR